MTKTIGMEARLVAGRMEDKDTEGVGELPTTARA